MDRKRVDGWRFWVLVAIADRERSQAEIHTRMVKFLRAAGGAEQVPANLTPLLEAMHQDGLVEKLGGTRFLERARYRLTAAGHEAGRNEVDLRRRELNAVDKDRDVRSWLGRSPRR